MPSCSAYRVQLLACQSSAILLLILSRRQLHLSNYLPRLANLSGTDLMSVQEHAGMAELDLEMGASEWRARGLPQSHGKNKRWGAPYHVQFRILFIR